MSTAGHTSLSRARELMGQKPLPEDIDPSDKQTIRAHNHRRAMRAACWAVLSIAQSFADIAQSHYHIAQNTLRIAEALDEQLDLRDPEGSMDRLNARASH